MAQSKHLSIIAWTVTATLVVATVLGWARQVSATGAPQRVGAGTVSALVIDPHTPTTLYAGGECATVKSADGASTWLAVNAGLAGTPVRTFAIDPTTPRTLYAATYGYGVFKSTDGAGSWQAANTGLTDLTVFALAIDPTMARTLYANPCYPTSSLGPAAASSTPTS